jgi:hypothetical protein
MYCAGLLVIIRRYYSVYTAVSGWLKGLCGPVDYKLQVMFKVSPTSLQTFIETLNFVLKNRVWYSTVHIPNVFCDGYLFLFFIYLLIFCFLYCNQVHRDFIYHPVQYIVIKYLYIFIISEIWNYIKGFLNSKMTPYI